MIELLAILGFEWDEGNRLKSAEKHNVSQAEAEQVFADRRLLVLVDDKHGGDEKQFHAYGETQAGRRLQVSFTLRLNATLIRVISACDMSRKERTRYGQET